MLEVLLLAATLGTPAAAVEEAATDEFLEFLAEFDAEDAEMFAADDVPAVAAESSEPASKTKPPAAAATEESQP